MPPTSNSQDPELRANLAQLKDLVIARAEPQPAPTDYYHEWVAEGGGTALRRNTKEGTFSIWIAVELTQEDQTDDKAGEAESQPTRSKGIELEFDELLAIRKASIRFIGHKGGGFNRPVKPNQVPSFVGNIVKLVTSEE